MLIGYGKPEELVPALVKRLKEEGEVTGVGAQKEITVEEEDMLLHLESALEEQGVKLHTHDSKDLIPSDRLPFKVSKTPDLYTSFRKEVEGLGLGTDGDMVVPPLQTASFEPNGKGLKVSVGPNGTALKPFPNVEVEGVWAGKGEGEKYADPKELYAALIKPLVDSPPIGGWPKSISTWPELNANSAIPFSGSESAALARLDDYVGHPKGGDGNGWVNGAKAKTYKDTRNGLVGEAFSTKFASFLALGTLSPKEAGWRVMGLLDTAGKDKGLWNNVYCEHHSHPVPPPVASTLK